MRWKFWKGKHCKIEDLIDAIGHFPKLTEVTDEPESEAKPNPLIELILKTQNLNELKQIYAKYKDSMSMAEHQAVIFQEFEIRMRDLDKRLSELEETMKGSHPQTLAKG